MGMGLSLRTADRRANSPAGQSAEELSCGRLGNPAAAGYGRRIGIESSETAGLRAGPNQQFRNDLAREAGDWIGKRN